MGGKNLKIVGNTIRSLRLAAAMSQEELADRAGLHRTYIGGIERGERNLGLENLITIATALGVRAADLLEALPLTKERESGRKR